MPFGLNRTVSISAQHTLVTALSVLGVYACAGVLGLLLLLLLFVALACFHRFGEQGAHGHVKVFGPSPWHFSQGSTEEQQADGALAMLEEQILLEGPGNIAAVS